MRWAGAQVVTTGTMPEALRAELVRLLADALVADVREGSTGTTVGGSARKHPKAVKTQTGDQSSLPREAPGAGLELGSRERDS